MSLLEIIRAKAPLSIAEYMELALTHPEYGYYMHSDPLGLEGDFVTAPEISQIFGEMIGLWLAEQWRLMGEPEAALVEIGPGRGTLMNDILRATYKVPGFHAAVSVHLVEASPTLRQQQWNTLAGKHAHLNWHSSITDIPPKPMLLAANEFFDALPIRQLMFDNGWQERMVSADENGTLSFGFTPVQFEGEPYAPKVILERCEAGIDMMNAIAIHFKQYRGAGLIIDYGYTQGSKGDTLQAIRDHAFFDPLQEPGSADLTAHVDFAALKQTAQAAGIQAFGPVPQGAWLTAVGAGVRLEQLCRKASPEQKAAMISGLSRLISIDEMGDLFKCLAIAHSNHPKPEGF